MTGDFRFSYSRISLSTTSMMPQPNLGAVGDSKDEKVVPNS